MDRHEQIVLADLNYVEALRDQTRSCGGTLVEEEGVVMMLGPGPHPILNNAVRMDESTDAGDCIELLSDYYGAYRHGYTLVLRNANDDSDLKAFAKESGLVPLLSPPEMVRTSKLPAADLPAGMEIRRVESAEDLADFRDVAEDAWSTYGIPAEVTRTIFGGDAFIDAPHVVGVVGYADGAAASCALVHLSHGIAGLYWVSTVGSARGRGLGEACTRAVTNIGFDMGARMVSLQASPMGLPIYERLGFEKIATYELLALIP